MNRNLSFAVFFTVAASLFTLTGHAQYEFVDVKTIEHTGIKSQDITGTCWSFSTASFVESELMRMGKGEIDLSEMFIVRKIYEDKARNYVLRQGKANFSQGALAHDLIRTMAREGIMLESAYPGLLDGDTIHNHSELEAALKGYLDGVLSQNHPSKKWESGFNGILDAYLGALPADDSKAYYSKLGLKAEDYISVTSFSHHPYGEDFILEIPDNYSNGSYYNVQLDDLVRLVNHALDKGFTLAWDGDVSEKGFKAKQGLAILPSDIDRDSVFQIPGEEIKVTQANRQENFESLYTTDDHLMHLIGRAKDKNGTTYYIIKNSWGEIGDFDGLLYMSESYLRMKTVSLLLHENGVPKDIKH